MEVIKRVPIVPYTELLKKCVVNFSFYVNVIKINEDLIANKLDQNALIKWLRSHVIFVFCCKIINKIPHVATQDYSLKIQHQQRNVSKPRKIQCHFQKLITLYPRRYEMLRTYNRYDAILGFNDVIAWSEVNANHISWNNPVVPYYGRKS